MLVSYSGELHEQHRTPRLGGTPQYRNARLGQGFWLSLTGFEHREFDGTGLAEWVRRLAYFDFGGRIGERCT